MSGFPLASHGKTTYSQEQSKYILIGPRAYLAKVVKLRMPMFASVSCDIREMKPETLYAGLPRPKTDTNCSAPNCCKVLHVSDQVKQQVESQGVGNLW